MNPTLTLMYPKEISESIHEIKGKLLHFFYSYFCKVLTFNVNNGKGHNIIIGLAGKTKQKGKGISMPEKGSSGTCGQETAFLIDHRHGH